MSDVKDQRFPGVEMVAVAANAHGRSAQNAELNGPPLHTSTPYRSEAYGICSLAKRAASATSKHYKIGCGRAVTFDPRLKLLFVLLGILITAYEILVLTMPYINTENFELIGNYVQTQFNAALDWSEENKLYSKVTPLLCGLLISSFSYALVYLDSDVPGVNPPSPFSPRSKQSFRQQKKTSLHLGYLCALGSGLVTTILMYANL